MFNFLFSSLYVLDTNPLSYVELRMIFYHFVGCLFIWLVVFFIVQKHFSFMISVVGLVSRVIRDLVKKSSPKDNSQLKDNLQVFLKQCQGIRSYIKILESFGVEAVQGCR